MDIILFLQRITKKLIRLYMCMLIYAFVIDRNKTLGFACYDLNDISKDGRYGVSARRQNTWKMKYERV